MSRSFIFYSNTKIILYKYHRKIISSILFNITPCMSFFAISKTWHPEISLRYQQTSNYRWIIRNHTTGKLWKIFHCWFPSCILNFTRKIYIKWQSIAKHFVHDDLSNKCDQILFRHCFSIFTLWRERIFIHNFFHLGYISFKKNLYFIPPYFVSILAVHYTFTWSIISR